MTKERYIAMVLYLHTVQGVNNVRTTALATSSTSMRSGKCLTLNQSHSASVTQPLFARDMSAYPNFSKTTSYLKALNVSLRRLIERKLTLIIVKFYCASLIFCERRGSSRPRKQPRLASYFRCREFFKGNNKNTRFLYMPV